MTDSIKKNSGVPVRRIDLKNKVWVNCLERPTSPITTNLNIVKMVFGSHLYGTATAKSDKDFKGVALPSWEQVALGKIPKHIEHSSTGKDHSKNTADDVDTEIFTIHNFVKLMLQGQTVAMDMLHAPDEMLITSSTLWNEIQANRHKAYSKNIHSFIGYAVGQAAKYGIKGSRLSDAKRVLEWLEKQEPAARLKDCDLTTFPNGEHIRIVLPEHPEAPVQYDVCGKRLQHTIKVQYAHDVISIFYNNYGARAKQAAKDQGIDWKAISHAFRAAFQMKELLTEGTITFPRPEAKLLTEIKEGKIKYLTTAPMLEDLIREVKELRNKSTLPEQPDTKFWDDFLMYVVEERIVPKK